ncbi:MAG: cytochrome c, partial [Planctomycetaceae bacterium]
AIVPIELLQAETKEIRTRLAAGLQTVATFNANTKAIETDGSVLALIADIIERHPQELNWKDRARHVRQLAYDIYLNANGKGRGPFQKSKEPFEKLVSIWDGGPAPDNDVSARAPLGEAGDRGKVMLYFESGFNWLRSDVNTPARMKDERDRVIRTTKVLAALGTALEDSSFDGADQEQYVVLLRQFIAGQQQLADAANSDDFATFEKARDSVQKSCDACHLEYRTRSAE